MPASAPFATPALREQAMSKLGRHGAHTDASAALAALHTLASTPATAADALALLHELQVHQVELELQDEERRTTGAALERALTRCTQLHEHAPVACFAIDGSSVITELNAAGARLLGGERAALPGRRLDAWLAPNDAEALRELLVRASAGRAGESCRLHLLPRNGMSRAVQAAAQADPAGSGFLVAWMDCGATPQDGRE